MSEVSWGGVTSLLEHFIQEQDQAGHDVHLLGPDSMPTFAGATQHRWRVDRGRPWTAATALLDLRRTVHRVQPDVVHLHSFVAGLLGRLPGQRRILPVPVVYQPHAWSFDLFSRPTLSRAVRRSESRAVHRTDVMVTNCVAEIEEGQANGIELPSHVLGVAVDLEAFHPVISTVRQDCRNELGITAKHVLVCVGRLSRQKGQDLLLASWERERPEDTQLILVGPGDTTSLRAQAPEQWGKTVLAVGEHADVRSWIWASDVVVLASRYETVAVVVAEAMACGRPVVATAVNGAEATIIDGALPAAGAVVPLGDMDALIHEATRRLEDEVLSIDEGTSGRLRAEQSFRAGLVAGRLERAYRQAIDEYPTRQARS